MFHSNKLEPRRINASAKKEKRKNEEKERKQRKRRPKMKQRRSVIRICSEPLSGVLGMRMGSRVKTKMVLKYLRVGKRSF